jgi:hypothetical protein
MTEKVDPGSFRDPDGAILHPDGRIIRGLSEKGYADWTAVRDSAFFPEALAAGHLIGTVELDDADLAEGWPHALEHDVVPFISYPYEWTFSMLRDAAALQLDLLSACLDHGLGMKDGYAYNIQFLGSRPIFIDIGSFAPGLGGPWAGYRQFCQTMLFPLMLTAHLGIAHPAGDERNASGTQQAQEGGAQARQAARGSRQPHEHHVLPNRRG